MGLRAAQMALAGTAVGRSLEPLGADRDSALYRARFPGRIAEKLDLSVPCYNSDGAADILASHDDAPIKFDARPANALLGPDGRLVWIDWDRAGRRNLADDAVSLLFDEYTAIRHATRDRLIAAHAPAFRGGRDADFCARYMRHAGLAQCGYRIWLILSRLAKDGRWGDAETCLRHDRIGTAPVHLIRLCDIALHLAATTAEIAPVSPLFQALRDWVSEDPKGFIHHIKANTEI